MAGCPITSLGSADLFLTIDFHPTSELGAGSKVADLLRPKQKQKQKHIGNNHPYNQINPYNVVAPETNRFKRFEAWSDLRQYRCLRRAPALWKAMTWDSEHAGI